MNTCLWTPTQERIENSNLHAFFRFIREHYGYSHELDSYLALHDWSIMQKATFWDAVWNFCNITGEKSESILENETAMPGARWFPEAKLNFAENLLHGNNDDAIALVERGEHGRREQLSFAELKTHVAKISAFLKAQGVSKGDCVAGFLPNSQHAVIAMLATASIGAIWTSCSPDFGLQGVLDRFEQTQPKVLFACDGYYYANKVIPTLDRVSAIQNGLSSLKACVIVPYLNKKDASSHDQVKWENILECSEAALEFEPMPFDAPLYVMYSSGTTGKPKCIVHTVGGTLIQHLKEHSLHTDVKKGTHLFYYTTCGWMMWNWLVSGLALGAQLILYDGSPFHPHNSQLFDLIDQENISIFGGSAKYYAACEKFGLTPKDTHKLEVLRTVLSTGSPLSHESFDYLYREVKQDICVSSISGGTDIISCFALGCPILPVYQGELQCIGLGMDVAFADDDGNPLPTGKGELICKQPFPSMPSGFWNDTDGEKYHDAYFSRFNHIWAHGDYGELLPHTHHNGDLTQIGVMIHGRSDAVLNPGGVRIGTAEIYRQVEKIPAIFESIAIGQPWKDDVRIVLFVRLKEGHQLDTPLINEIKQIIRANTTARHVPQKIIQVTDIPRTISGKIVELAVKKVVQGLQVTNTEALANPEALNLYRNIPALQED